MSQRPAVLSPSQLRDAAAAAVLTAVEERTIAMTEHEARNTSGGLAGPTGPVPTLSGAVSRPILLDPSLA